MDETYAKSDLTAQLLGSWWAIAIDALVETAGSDRALEALRPHYIHSGRAAFLFMSKRMKWDARSMEDTCKFLALAHSLLKKGVDHAMVRGEEECLVRFSSCPFAQGPRESCMAVCYHLLLGVGEQLGPDFEVEMPKMMKNGDLACIKWVSRKGIEPSTDPTDWKEVDFQPRDMTQEERDWFFRAYMGEMWIMVLRAFSDLYGKEMTLQALVPRMRAEGLSFGARMRSDGREGDSTEAIMAVAKALGQSISVRKDENDTQLLVSECPLSGSLEACFLYEAFLDGLCAALQEGSGFSYSHRMAEGDGVCAGIVRHVP